ncbi:hypothetical protein [Chlorobaculum limnaeum]|uniref:hypothetical protein n=1 Tax=Chlorobaculum limnaeum TaxID=274537 RepID=UPI0012ED56B0|nr:hypothetical protein [Chlorobaculum limnaeum]
MLDNLAAVDDEPRGAGLRTFNDTLELSRSSLCMPPAWSFLKQVRPRFRIASSTHSSKRFNGIRMAFSKA